MLYSKSQAAFALSAERLFEHHTHVYFWTFTFKKVQHDWRAMYRWNEFSKMMQALCPMWHGLRVTELHEMHGIHFHALLVPRMCVHLVRKISGKCEFGRIHVKRADRGAINYLIKYVTPRNKDSLTAGMRRWGTVGGFKHVPVRNIEVESQFHRNMKELTQGRKADYLYTRDVYNRTQLEGPVREWTKLKQDVRRVYFLNPSLMFKPKPLDKDGRRDDTYPQGVGRAVVYGWVRLDTPF